MKNSNKKSVIFLEGLRDGLPIGGGYFAVSFSLGILAKKAGLDWVQGFFASMLNVASAGEKALFDGILNGITYLEIALITFVVNARYLLMSCSLSQKFGPATKMFHRFILGFGVTDELFGITMARPGKIEPAYNYGAMVISIFLWSFGTSLGIVAGNILPDRVVSALSVALYGMFIAIIVPPAKTSRPILFGVLASFVFSFLFSIIPGIRNIDGGIRTIILTVAISAVLAIAKPVQEESEETKSLEDGDKTSGDQKTVHLENENQGEVSE